MFVGRSRDGKAVFANQRGTYDRNGSSFKGDVPGSDKSTAFRLPRDPANDTVYVFEAPIDLMSYCTLHRDLRGNAIALCCLHDGALETYLKDHPGLRRIVLCLDNDTWGRKAVEHMREKYSTAGYSVQARFPPAGKDWNEYLSQRHHIRERGRYQTAKP